MTLSIAKDFVIKYFLNHTSVIYIDNDSDFSVLKNAYHETINPHSNVKILKSIIKLKDINPYAEFKEYSTHKITAKPAKRSFEITLETNNPRELYVIDFYSIDNEQCLSCIDVYSKFASLIKTNSRDWLEAKRDLTRIFNDMGKPQKTKADKDSAFMSYSLKVWLYNEETQLISPRAKQE